MNIQPLCKMIKKLNLFISTLFLLFTCNAFCQIEVMYKAEPINKEIADSLKAYELTNRAFTNIALTFEIGNNNLKMQLAQKSIQERTLYYVSILDMQVLNGGVYQYFSNYENQYDAEIISALETLERIELATEFKKICSLYSKDFDEVNIDYDKFDESYYKYNKEKSMNEYLKEYILENLEIFETK